MALREALHGEFTIDHGNDDTASAGRQCTIQNQHIDRVNASFTHRRSSHADEKGSCGMLNEVLIEVEGAIEVVISRGRIASRDGDEEQETLIWCREVRRSHYVHGHRYSLPRP